MIALFVFEFKLTSSVSQDENTNVRLSVVEKTANVLASKLSRELSRPLTTEQKESKVRKFLTEELGIKETSVSVVTDLVRNHGSKDNISGVLVKNFTAQINKKENEKTAIISQKAKTSEENVERVIRAANNSSEDTVQTGKELGLSDETIKMIVGLDFMDKHGATAEELRKIRDYEDIRKWSSSNGYKSEFDAISNDVSSMLQNIAQNSFMDIFLFNSQFAGEILQKTMEKLDSGDEAGAKEELTDNGADSKTADSVLDTIKEDKSEGKSLSEIIEDVAEEMQKLNKRSAKPVKLQNLKISKS